MSPDSEPAVMEVYIHGWVYDIENGQVSDLGVSVGPSGKIVAPTPFPTITRSGKCTSAGADI